MKTYLLTGNVKSIRNYLTSLGYSEMSGTNDLLAHLVVIHRREFWTIQKKDRYHTVRQIYTLTKTEPVIATLDQFREMIANESLVTYQIINI